MRLPGHHYPHMHQYMHHDGVSILLLGDETVVVACFDLIFEAKGSPCPWLVVVKAGGCAQPGLPTWTVNEEEVTSFDCNFHWRLA